MANLTFNTTPSAQGDPMGRSKATIIAQVTSMATLGVVIVLGNLASIAIFIKTQSLRKRCHYLIISMSVADIMVGLVAFMAAYYFSTSPVLLSRTIPAFLMSLETLDHFSAMISILTLATISVERCHAIGFPLRHKSLPSAVYVTLISLPWVVAIVVTIFGVLSYSSKRDLQICQFLSIVLPSFSLFIILLAYIGIGVKVRKKNSITSNTNRQLRDQKLAVTLLIVTFASLATWLPSQIVYSIDFFCKTCTRPSFNSFFAIKFLQFSNSGLNVFIYIFRIPEFRATFLSSVFCQNNISKILKFVRTRRVAAASRKDWGDHNVPANGVLGGKTELRTNESPDHMSPTADRNEPAPCLQRKGINSGQIPHNLNSRQVNATNEEKHEKFAGESQAQNNSGPNDKESQSKPCETAEHKMTEREDHDVQHGLSLDNPGYHGDSLTTKL